MTQRRTPWLTATLGLLVLVLAACSTPAATEGTLDVTVTAPTGVTLTPNVSVTSAVAGFTPTTITTTGKTSLSKLKPGSYTITPSNVTAGGKTYTATVATSPATVTAGNTTSVTVAYVEVSAAKATLNVTISGLPGGVNANVTVTGPSSFSQNLTATQTLVNLNPGTYTTTANSVSSGGTTYSAVVTGSPTALVAGDNKPVTVVYSPGPTTGNLVVTVAGSNGGAVTVRAKPASGTAPTPQTRTGDGTVTFTALAFGTYSITASSVITGTYVDSFYFTPSAVSANHNAATTNATVTLVKLGGTGNYSSGRVFLAGNGAFNDEPLATTQSNAIYSITDANLGLGSPVLDTVLAPSSTLGAFRVTFDKSGNMYVIYQNLIASGAGDARIIRVTEANLRANKLAETDTGNVKITGFTGPGPAFNSEPADIAFDSQDNMWLVNDKGGNITCYSAASMKAAEASGSLSTYNQKLVDAAAAAGVFRNPHSVVFDRDDHLWFTSDKTSVDAPPPGDLAFKSRLARVNKSVLNCTGTNVDTAVTPDIILDVSNSNPANPGGVVVKPIVLALAPDGKSFWIADYGGDDRGDKDPENILQIPLTGTNITTNTGTDPAGGKEAIFGFRLYAADFLNFNTNPSYAPQSQIQQPFGLAFDKNGDIWVATNNNISRLNPAPTPEITDFKGKLWQIKIPTTSDAGCMNFAGGFAVSTRVAGKAPCDENLANYTPNPIKKIISAPVIGVGFVGISFNIAPANAPMYVRPTP